MIAPWAQEELAGAALGDERLNARFELLLSTLGARPNLSIPAACRGRAEIKAAYRFFDNDGVTFENILQPHIDRSVQRVQQQPVALLVQDTTEIEQSRPKQPVAGVGQLDHTRPGFLLHEMQAFATDGPPLGTVWAEVLNRIEGVSDADASEKTHERKHTPIEEKESLRWLTGLRAARAVAQRVPGVTCVCIADSEGDIYECFAEPRGNPSVHWLVRGCQDRALKTEPITPTEPATPTEPVPHLRDHLLAMPVRYTAELRIRGREAKIAGEDRTRRQNRVSRETTVAVRSAVVTLRPPWRHDRVLAAVTVNRVPGGGPGRRRPGTGRVARVRLRRQPRAVGMCRWRRHPRPLSSVCNLARPVRHPEV